MKYSWIALIALLMIGCSADAVTNSNVANATPAAVPSRTAEPPTTPSPSPTTPPADEAASETSADFEGTAGITEKKSPTGGVLLKETRSAKHGNFDRVVFEFEGAQLPSYKIEYIDKPVRACGSGDVVPFQGDAWLSVRFTGANAHTEAGEPTIKDRTRSPNHTIIKDLKLICDFEAEVEWVLGVSSPNKYRVLELKNPTRLVVDVRH